MKSDLNARYCSYLYFICLFFVYNPPTLTYPAVFFKNCSYVFQKYLYTRVIPMKLLNVAILVASLGNTAVVFANTGTITINGRIFTETCVLSGTDQATGKKNVNVVLNTIPSSNFTPTKRESAKKDFAVSLTKADGTVCVTPNLGEILAPVVTLATTQVTDYDATDKTLLVNKDPSAPNEAAKKVFLQILAKPNASDEGTAVDFSSTTGQAKATYDQANNKFYYTAQYNAGAGTTLPDAQIVNAVVNYSITYP